MRTLIALRWAGYLSEMIRFPEQRFTVIVLANSAGADPGGMAMKIADLYLEPKEEPGEGGGSTGQAVRRSRRRGAAQARRIVRRAEV